MPIKAMPRFTAWSYSRLSDYEACPLKAKIKHLDKVSEPSSPALKRGSDIHELAAKYATNQLTELEFVEKVCRSHCTTGVNVPTEGVSA